ncbi:MAG: hypothetical protein AAF433_00780 [Bacteroidota bacterium]
MFSSDVLLFVVIIVIIGLIYWPIIRMANREMAERRLAGKSDQSIMLLLLIPILGPLIYLAIRQLKK